MRKKCPECLGLGFINDIDSDGYGSEVLCGDCDGEGSVIDTDAERTIKNE